MMQVETRDTILSKSQIKDIDPPVEDYQVFNVSLYLNLYNQVIESGFSDQEASAVVRYAIINDSVGVVTEKLSGEKGERGDYLFDVEDRIRMQLTPSRHFYFHEKDSVSGEDLMVAPEHRWRDFKKDVLGTISGWRRGMDKVSMAGVRTLFLDSENVLEEGEYLFWFSPRAEEWESETVVKYNGAYGFLYEGKVITIDGARVLEVHDFKNDLSAESYAIFAGSLEGEVFQNPGYLNRPMVDKVKSTVVRAKGNYGVENIWRRLGKIQENVTGKNEIFGLPPETIIALQDIRLHEKIREEVAVPVADWLLGELASGISVNQIQSKVRQKFIKLTRELLLKIKQEELSDRRLDTSLLDVTIPFSDSKYTNPMDQAILVRYTGSSGDGCGSWGGSNNNSIFRNGNPSIRGFSSVEVMSTFFANSGGCQECSRSSVDNHYHCPKCKKSYADETHKTVRTARCGCGFEFGC